MAYKKFKEFVTMRDVGGQGTNLNKQQAIMSSLQTAMKTPPPAGSTPQDYQQKLRSAMMIARTGVPNSASSAMDVANLQQKSIQ